MKSDIDKLLTKSNKLLESIEEARGSSKELIKAPPLEIEFYNIVTLQLNSVKGFIAILKDIKG